MREQELDWICAAVVKGRETGNWTMFNLLMRTLYKDARAVEECPLGDSPAARKAYAKWQQETDSEHPEA